MSDLKKAKEILSDITGYTVDELTERNTEPLLQAEDCLTAMYCFLAQHLANDVPTNNSGLHKHIVINPVCPKCKAPIYSKDEITYCLNPDCDFWANGL